MKKRRDFAIGRSTEDASEVDGNVFVEGKGAERLKPRELVQVTAGVAEDYDLLRSKNKRTCTTEDF
jgi:hypothetical protein